MSSLETTPASVRHSFWKRRIVLPILVQLQQGVTADRLAVTVAMGFVLGIFPILGATTLLCLLAGLVLKLNQPVIQLINYFTYPLQVALLIPFYKAGGALFGQPQVSLSIPLLIDRFRADAFEFLKSYAMIGLRGVVVWLLVAPCVGAGVFYLVRPGLRTLERRVVA